MQVITEAHSDHVTLSDKLYEADMHFTRITEYGFSLTDFLNGQATPPAGGARVDVAFEGTLIGSKVNGRMSGVDYLHLRADGQTSLHIHAEITTDDGEKIAFFGDGVINDDRTHGLLHFSERVTFTTSYPAHRWMSGIGGWGRGTVDPVKGEIKVTLFAI
jgi:hypothetical protein